MPRRFGSVDRFQRKGRSDKGRKRSMYNGRPVRTKRYYKNEKKIRNQGILKVWVWQRVPRSQESKNKFSPRVRPFMARHPITIFRMRHDLDVKEIDCKWKIERFFEENYWGGTFLLMGFSHGKNRYHVKPVKLCEVIVHESPNGLRARFYRDFRMQKYKWFWKG